MKLVDETLERSILAAAIRRPHLLDRAGIRPELFAAQANASLAGAIAAHHAEGNPATIELAVREQHPKAVAECLDASDPHHTIGPGFSHGLKRLRRLASSRLLMGRLDRHRAALLEGELEAVTDGLGDVLEGVDLGDGQPMRTFGDAAGVHVRRLLSVERDGENETGLVQSGLEAIDIATKGGFRKGSLWVVGGRSGCRKSSVILRAARTALRDGFEPAIISIEDPEDVWGERIVALEAADAGLGSEVNSLVRAASLASQLGGRIVYPLDGTPAAVLDCVRRAVADGSKVVFVDYVQALQFPDNVRRLDKATANFARAVRTICRRTGAVAVVGSQVTTDRDKAHKEPTPYDLRESRELFDASDILTLTWKPNAAHDDVVLGRVGKVKWAAGGQPFALEIAAQGMVTNAHYGHPNDAAEFDDEDESGARPLRFSRRHA